MDIVLEIDNAIINYKKKHHYIEPQYLVMSHSGLMFLKHYISKESKTKGLVHVDIWVGLRVIETRRNDIIFDLF